MMDARIAAAQALDPLLEAFRATSGKILRAVSRSIVDGCFQKLALDFDDASLIFEAQAEFDTIDWVATTRSTNVDVDRADASRSMPWQAVMGKRFSSGWIAINQQGYGDGVLLSFEGLAPQVLLIVAASSIKESFVEPVRK